MFRNMASSLFLSLREAEVNEAGEEYRDYDTPADGRNIPKVPGRIVTTLQKAKTLRPMVEKCITIACKGLAAEEAASQFGTESQRHSAAWKQWRQSEDWNRWAQAMAPVVVARRRVLQMVGNKAAMEVLFSTVAPRFRDRPGGYTRIVRLATPRLGDAGTRAILELVGTRDRVRQKSEKPAFDDEGNGEDAAKEPAGRGKRG
jgi:large subunit ribosomal protein L17